MMNQSCDTNLCPETKTCPWSRIILENSELIKQKVTEFLSTKIKWQDESESESKSKPNNLRLCAIEDELDRKKAQKKEAARLKRIAKKRKADNK